MTGEGFRTVCSAILAAKLTLAVIPLDLTQHIRDIPDFPTQGILFRDITPLLHHPPAFRFAVDQIAEKFADVSPDAIVGIDARGFLFSSPLAYKLGVPLVPVRKKGKLPYETTSVSYDLEYGTDSIEVHVDAIQPGDQVLIVDDLIATGGTLAATAELIERTGGEVAGVGVVIELSDLKGRDLLNGYTVKSLLTY